MGSSLALPDPARNSVPQLRAACVDVIWRRNEIIGVWSLEEARRGYGTARVIERYLQGKEGRADAEKAARIFEAAIGAALGPAEVPERNPDGTLTGSLAREAVSIPKNDRHRFRLIAEYREAWESRLDGDGGLSRAEVLRIIDRARRENVADIPTTCSVNDLASLDGREFGTIYADPPWLYGNQATRAATGNHYGGMTIEEICALPVRDIMAPDAHCHLWTTNAFLFDAKAVLEAWGFEYKSCFVWVKPQMGIGNYWRVSHEFLLLGTRGSAPFRDRAQMSWREWPRGRHSAKPHQLYEILEAASPAPYLELFARQQRRGWTSWGNEIDRDLFYNDIAG